MSTHVQRTIRWRRNTAEDWVALNPILAEGEPGYEKRTKKFKIGDGVSRWTELPYFNPTSSEVSTGNEVVDQAITAHIESQTPHPVYDNGPSLVLLYQNAKV